MEDTKTKKTIRERNIFCEHLSGARSKLHITHTIFLIYEGVEIHRTT